MQLVWILVFNLCVGGYCAPSLFEDDLEALSKNRTLDEKLKSFEGDMVLPESTIHRAVTKGKILAKGTSKDSGKRAAMTKPLWYRWPNAEVPYQISRSLKCRRFCAFLDPEKIIKGAMYEWSKKTCVRFRPRRYSDRNWVLFKSASTSRCASEVGRVGGMQYIWLGLACLKHGIVLHEIGHTLGFYHEQSRPDRDEYIKIHWDNIATKYHKQFKKYESYSDMGTPYDYDSVMHYGKNDFRLPYKFFRHAITTKKKWNKKLGQRKYLSKIDAEEMNLYYKCPKKN